MSRCWVHHVWVRLRVQWLSCCQPVNTHTHTHTHLQKSSTFRLHFNCNPNILRWVFFWVEVKQLLWEWKVLTSLEESAPSSGVFNPELTSAGGMNEDLLSKFGVCVCVCTGRGKSFTYVSHLEVRLLSVLHLFSDLWTPPPLLFLSLSHWLSRVSLKSDGVQRCNTY